MTVQTLTIREAETQLQSLVKQAQTTHQPVFLTSEERAAPVAVLLEMEQYAANPNLIVATRLDKLEGLLDLLTNHWDTETIRQTFPRAWRWHLEGVWETSRHRETSFRQLVVLLQMAAQGLNMTTFTHAHLDLWRQCLHILRQPNVSQEGVAQCDQALIHQGFPVLLNFDDDIGLTLYASP